MDYEVRGQVRNSSAAIEGLIIGEEPLGIKQTGVSLIPLVV